MSEKAGKAEILKNEDQSQVKIFWQKLMFWSETFIQVFLENFLYVSWTRSKYLEIPLNQVLCVGKKNRDNMTQQSDYIAKNVLGETKVCTICYVKKFLLFVTKEQNRKLTWKFLSLHFVCHFEPLFKIFCWSTNSAKFSLLREKIRFFFVVS